MTHPFKKFFVLFIALFVVLNSYGQAQPSYNNVQYATGGILQYHGQAMGYAANDPRMHSTLYTFGKSVAASAIGSVVAAAGTGLLVTATAPAWVTAVASAAILGAVGSAVYLGIDALVKWIFGSGTAPITTVMPAPTTMTFPYQKLSLVTGTAYTNLTALSTTQFRSQSMSPQTQSWSNYCYGGDALSVASCSHAGIQPYVTIGGTRLNLWFGGVRAVTSYGTSFYQVDVFDTTSAMTSLNTYATISMSVYNWQTDNFGDNIRVFCEPGSARPHGSSTCIQYATVNPNAPAVTTPNQTMVQAVNALTAAQKAQKVNYDTMALLVNSLWQQAAAKPDYNGIPYSATNPITAAEVQVWANANPSIYPTVADLIAPVTDPNNFAPCTNGSTCAPATASTPTTTTTTTTNGTTTTSTSTVTGTAQPVTVTNKVSVDLGVDPNIGSPTLETTPTANSILAPVLNLVPSFKNFVVPSHTATCPMPAFDVWGKHFVMDAHCTLFEQQRATLYSTMMLAFMLVAIFIVLSA